MARSFDRFWTPSLIWKWAIAPVWASCGSAKCALRFDACSYQSLKSMLAYGLDHQPLVESPPLELPSSTPTFAGRSTSIHPRCWRHSILPPERRTDANATNCRKALHDEAQRQRVDLRRISFSKFRDWLREFLKMGCFCQRLTAWQARSPDFARGYSGQFRPVESWLGARMGGSLLDTEQSAPPNLVWEM